ncbi:MAG: FecR family protein [Prevotella sp.]
MITSNRNHLEELREKVDAMTDQQLGDALHEEWMNDTIDVSEVGDDDIKRVKSNIDSRITTGKSSARRIALRWIQIAAAMLFPICLVGLLMMYNENRQYASIPDMQIKTGLGEQVTVTLPDGTQVSLNSMSTLTYAPQSFCKSSREVDFDGEAYFKVAKNAELPFVLHVSGADVEVLGTEFNVVDREVENTTELALVKGKVMLTANASGKSYTMTPNEIATIDKTTGDINVRSGVKAAEKSMWKQKRLSFSNAKLDSVVKALERTYGVKVKVKASSDDTFTGTLPTDNLDEALRIIEITYK